MSADEGNVLSYNVNIGELSGYKEGFLNTIGGIIIDLRKCNIVHYNINAGTILVDPKGEADPPLQPWLKKCNMIGGIVACLYDEFDNEAIHNKIAHSINASMIVTNKAPYVVNCVGVIIAQNRSFSGNCFKRNHFEHNIYSSALISHTPTMEQRFQSDPEANLGSNNPFINVRDFSTISNWPFGLTQDWILMTKGPMLTWLFKDRALILLQYFNHLKVLHTDNYLPMEMMLDIAGALDDFSYLSFEYIQRIYHYALTPASCLVQGFDKLKCNWSKEDFLVYVLENT